MFLLKQSKTDKEYHDKDMLTTKQKLNKDLEKPVYKIAQCVLQQVDDQSENELLTV